MFKTAEKKRKYTALECNEITVEYHQLRATLRKLEKELAAMPQHALLERTVCQRKINELKMQCSDKYSAYSEISDKQTNRIEKWATGQLPIHLFLLAKNDHNENKQTNSLFTQVIAASRAPT